MTARSSEREMPPISLDAWLREQPDQAFPPHGGIPYPTRFDNVAGYLNANIHPHVEKGALVKGDGYLTNHGPSHIETVIKRSGDLLGHPAATYPQFTPYEVYLLLMAAHFHDVGNLYGREEHAEKLAPIMEHLGQLVGSEMVERQAIMRIARAHATDTDGNKATIDRLPQEDPVLGHDVRYQSLAAILRFADELSDDSNRAARAIQELGQLPRNSEIFHAYARALHTVLVRPAQRFVTLRFSLTKEDATRQFGKGNGQAYLLDEIYSRTLKMHFEREYCMRFTYGLVRIDAIDVRIEVFADQHSMTPCVDPIGYVLRQTGYPGNDDAKITDICPDVTLDGASLLRLIQGAAQ